MRRRAGEVPWEAWLTCARVQRCASGDSRRTRQGVIDFAAVQSLREAGALIVRGCTLHVNRSYAQIQLR